MRLSSGLTPVHQFSRGTHGYIHARDAHIHAINDFEALLIRVESPGKGPRRITRERTTATDANFLGSKAGTWAIPHRGVEEHSEQRNVKRGRGIFEAADVRKVRIP